MKRRAFLQRIGAAVIGLTLARHLPGIAPSPPTLPLPETLRDEQLGIAIRFVKRFDVETARHVSRFDVFWPMVVPELSCRIQG